MLPTFRLRRKKVSQKESLIKQNNSNNPSISASLIVLELHRHRHKANCKLTKLGKCQVYKYRYRLLYYICMSLRRIHWKAMMAKMPNSIPFAAFLGISTVATDMANRLERVWVDAKWFESYYWTTYMRDSTTTQCTCIQPTKLTCVHEMGNLIGQS